MITGDQVAKFIKEHIVDELTALKSFERQQLQDCIGRSLHSFGRTFAYHVQGRTGKFSTDWEYGNSSLGSE